ncbi:NAD+ synthase [Membranihabitans marinus]|uniref:NAD+ synthase n=1 Tax=Membranihabitans marinus TaxID=1227546 RepID=UPI001F0088AD|nr:NAD+ synthase [Membranihabitans marinus]
MNIAIAQINYHIGNFEGNYLKMKAAIESAEKQGADIVCFSELATTGYPARDFLDFDDFIDLSNQLLEKLVKLSNNIAIVVGAPTVNPVLEGKDLYNSVYFLNEGKIEYVQHKALLPTYDIFDENRYFEAGNEFGIVHFKGKKIALSVCEDIWNVGNENPMYTICPLDEVMDENPDFVINVSASPFDYTKAEDRIAVLKENVDRYKIPFFYINHCGAQTELVFDGGSLVVNQEGKVVAEMPYFEEALSVFNLSEITSAREENVQDKTKITLIHDAIVLGIKDYFNKLGFKTAVLGLSGGIDSAVTCALAVRALGAENVRVALMPSQFSSDHSVKDAMDLVDNLGIQSNILNIESSYQAILETLNPVFEGRPFNVAEENIQARIRGLFVMAISNKFGNILLNTSNKSEAAVGYGTLYGDMAGGLSVLGDVYKTEVFELARYINKDSEVIPVNSIVKPPSAELRPDQKDSDSLPEYDILDEILYQYIEETMSPQDIIDRGYDEALVARILRLVNINEFKRYQAPPIIRVSRKAFGMGRRMPIVGKYLS